MYRPVESAWKASETGRLVAQFPLSRHHSAGGIVDEKPEFAGALLARKAGCQELENPEETQTAHPFASLSGFGSFNYQSAADIAKPADEG